LLECPYKVRKTLPVVRSQIFMMLSLPPEASQRLSGLKATALTDCVCPVWRINSGLSLRMVRVFAEVCAGPDGTTTPRLSGSFVCARPWMGAQITDNKTIAADICRCSGRDKNEMCRTLDIPRQLLV